MFAKTPSVVIAKVDSTENDTPAKIQGFPTLLFYPAGAKQNPITFNGDRTEDGMDGSSPIFIIRFCSFV
jgi:hypothetical protein